MFADNLRALREEKQLSQSEIASILNIPQKTYSNYETGKSEPKYATLRAIADFYKVSIDFLLDRYTSPEKK